jgi:hypothetical protein
MRRRRAPLQMVVWQCPRTGESQIRLSLRTAEDPRELGMHGLVRWLAFVTRQRVRIVLGAGFQDEWWSAWTSALAVASRKDMDLHLRDDGCND